LAHCLDAQCRQGSLILLISPAGAFFDVGSRCLGIMTIRCDHFKKGSDLLMVPAAAILDHHEGGGVWFLCDAKVAAFCS